MLQKLKILTLLAKVVAVSLSASPIATKIGQDQCALKTSMGQLQDGVKDGHFLLAEAMSNFTQNLEKVLYDHPDNQDKNILFSPLSIHIAIGMIWAASQKQSAPRRQMAKALGINDECSDVYLSNYKEIMNDYAKLNGVDLRMANGMFLRENVTEHYSKLRYKHFMHKFYLAKIKTLRSGDGEVVAVINNFVKKETEGMISLLLESAKLDLLVNAIYFKSEWKFDPSKTAEMVFTLHDGEQICVSGMTMTSTEIEFADYSKINSRVLKLLYKNRFEMFVIKPNRNDPESLKFAAKFFNHDDVKLNFEAYPEGTNITMPIFKASFFTELVEAMKAMGIEDIFSKAGVDLRNLFHIKGDEFVKVSNILHKTAIEVNDKGSEASAGTASCVNPGAEPTEGGNSVDWPFAFKIIDIETSITVFEGIIVNPAEQTNPVVASSKSP